MWGQFDPSLQESGEGVRWAEDPETDHHDPFGFVLGGCLLGHRNKDITSPTVGSPESWAIDYRPDDHMTDIVAKVEKGKWLFLKRRQGQQDCSF
jgi:hypothetical protein